MSRWLTLIGLSVFLTACGSDAVPVAPTPPPPASVAGNWSGTFQGTQQTQGAFLTPIVMGLSQAGSTVSGTWATNAFGPTGAQGTVSGATTTSTFSGTFTWNSSSSTGTACTGTFAVFGTAGGNTLTWTSPGVTANCTNLPTGITIAVQVR